MSEVVLSTHHLCKSFGSVKVLEGVDLAIKSNSVHALCGENGAGKSTIIKLLTGVYSSYQGEIRIKGTPLSDHSIKKAMQLGIAVVHQEFSILDNLSVAENILLESEPNRYGFLDRKKMHTKCQEVLERLSIDIEPQTELSKLSTAQHQLVEIAQSTALSS